MEKKGRENRELRKMGKSECRQWSPEKSAAEVLWWSSTGNEVAPEARRGRSNMKMG